MHELRGGVDDKIQGPRTDTCETPQNRYREKRNYFHISHGKDERTDKI